MLRLRAVHLLQCPAPGFDCYAIGPVYLGLLFVGKTGEIKTGRPGIFINGHKTTTHLVDLRKLLFVIKGYLPTAALCTLSHLVDFVLFVLPSEFAQFLSLLACGFYTLIPCWLVSNCRRRGGHLWDFKSLESCFGSTNLTLEFVYPALGFIGGCLYLTVTFLKGESVTCGIIRLRVAYLVGVCRPTAH